MFYQKQFYCIYYGEIWQPQWTAFYRKNNRVFLENLDYRESEGGGVIIL